MRNRKIGLYILLIAITVPLGLSTRKYGYAFPDIISTYGGDVLYATLIFFLVRLAGLKWSLPKVALFSYLFCIGIETLQLYQAPWIQAVRHTFPFGLILGYGFLWSDWVCYSIGIAIALVICVPSEKLINKKTEKVF